jgi:lantibiotic modifying enzyme
MKGLLQERLVVEGESSRVLKMRRHELYNYLKSRGRYYEAFEVARMEMKFGVSNLDQLHILQGYLEVSGKFNVPKVNGSNFQSYVKISRHTDDFSKCQCLLQRNVLPRKEAFVNGPHSFISW